MHRSLLSILPTTLLLACATAGRCADKPTLKDAFALEEALQEAIRKAEPSVVCILTARQATTGRGLDDPDAVPESFGSGVVIGVDATNHGLVLTHFHVVQNATQIYVRFLGGKGSRVQRDQVTGDGRCDLAVLRLDDPLPVEPPVQPIKLGDGDHVRKGQMVLSIANPFAAGFHDGSPSASWGIISNIRRRAPRKGPLIEQDRARISLHQYGTLLQTDARLNLGCSGGALIDLKGELIGLTTAQAALSGSETAGGFAIPMTTNLKKIVEVLKKGQPVDYGFLGVSFGTSTSGEHGVRITEVIAGSPAARAGLPNGSLITAINGMQVRDTDDLVLAISTSLAGSKAQLQVQYVPRPITVTLTKFDYPGPILAANRPPFVRGLRVDYTSVLMQRHRDREIANGVFVSEVLAGSPAESARLQEAVITQVNGVAVNSPADFYREAAKKPGPLELTVAGRPDKVRLE